MDESTTDEGSYNQDSMNEGKMDKRNSSQALLLTPIKPWAAKVVTVDLVDTRGEAAQGGGSREGGRSNIDRRWRGHL